MGQLALTGLLCTPALGAVLLAAIPRYRLAAALNVSLCALTLGCAAALYRHRPEPSLYLLVDDLNTVFLFVGALVGLDRKSTRLNSSHSQISYAVFCLKKKK